MLVTLLFYYDHNVSSLTAQAKQFPLKKPAGFHCDFFLLGCTSFVAGIVGIPFPNGLVPQAPVHTDVLTDYREDPKVVHTNQEDKPEVYEKETTPVRVVEQRLSHFLMGIAIIGTMTGPLLVVLSTMPRAVFSGVFFVVGGSIEGNGITAKLLFLLKEHRFIQPSKPLLKLRKRRILYFVFWQLLGWACTVAISQTIAAIGK
ncbi:MAG: HCO3- transporter family [Lasallia pustulata]|uniref:HCO3-transporter family n=1 Tax=Lasallia pustulata TaxID=136370 RepID=A0A5M8PGR2_9LECA|nr:MAG: HCO3- transporter family [Lasallia pustulata]